MKGYYVKQQEFMKQQNKNKTFALCFKYIKYLEVKNKINCVLILKILIIY